jgi:hypothetical protein
MDEIIAEKKARTQRDLFRNSHKINMRGSHLGFFNIYFNFLEVLFSESLMNGEHKLDLKKFFLETFKIFSNKAPLISQKK